MFFAFVLFGLFLVYVAHNTVNKKDIATQQGAILSIPSLTPTPSPIQILNITPSTTATNISNEVTAVIKTERGNIELTLSPQEAPNTVANFVQKAKSGFYNNLTFHRVEDWVVQGGDPLGNGTGGGNIPVEFNSQPFVVGSLGVASRGDGKTQNDAQFFITKTDAPWLNGQYTNFGIVNKGMDVVSQIEIGDKILGIDIK